MGAVSAIVRGITEGLDVTNAFWKALPRDRRTRGADQVQRARDLYNNWQHVDLGEAFRNVVENEVEDRFFGAIGRGLGQFGRATGRPVGAGAGPWDTAHGDYARDYDRRQRERNKDRRRWERFGGYKNR